MNKNRTYSYSLTKEPKMINQNTKTEENRKISNDILLEFRLGLNKKLYDENIISLEVYQNMENYLIKKLNRYRSI